MPNEYSTNALIGVVQGFPTPPSALLDRYFPMVSTSEAEEIHFDVIPGKRRVAPFVSPLVEGKVVEKRGHATKTFKPAYVKDKRPFVPSDFLKRAVGEQIGGSLSPQQRRDAKIAAEMQDQIEMLNRRMELMASEAIRTGKVTVVGDGYPSTLVDFGRDNALTPTALSSNARWGQSAEDPLGNLETWGALVLKKSGRAATDVIMGVDAWTAFRKNAEVKSRLDTRNVLGNALQTTSQFAEGLSFKGTIDGFNIFVYGGWYVDPADDTEKEIWPADIVAMLSPGVEGVRAYGAILDGKAGLRAMPFFPKMWEEEDPAVEWLMMQSAPLAVPTMVDATLAVDVL
jgi:hypothetical protein